MITELQKRFEADAYKQKMNYAGSAGIAAEQGFLAGVNFLQHLLQQHNVGGSLPVDKVTRVEVIDKSGRAYVSWNKSNKVSLQLQDDNKTLKVFVSERQ